LLSLASPIWLFGLALLPVIRWLHRTGPHRRTLPVSRLALWRGSADTPPGAGERRPPDPAWRRRALMTALLLIALAEPQWPHQRPPLTIWVDDSISMLTREAQGHRLAQGLAQIRSLLAEGVHGDVQVRTLADPWRNLGGLTEASIAAVVAGAGRKEPSAPPAALLLRERLHWLVTDGADAASFEWPGGMRADRVIQVADVSRNVGLERLSARRDPNAADKIDLLLKVTNGGTAVETREVVFITDAGEVARSTHRLDPGASALVKASIPASTRVRVTLQPGDALAQDDEVVLDLARLRRHRVAADSRCPGPLLAAVAAHPALALAPADASDVEAVLDCGARGEIRDKATIRMVAERTPVRLRGSIQWPSSIAESRRVKLDPERMLATARLVVRPADIIVLAVGDEPVIVQRAGPPQLVETSLDLGQAELSGGAEVPLLLNLMIERVLGGRLLDEIALTDRGPASARVAPLQRLAASRSERAPSDSRLLGDWSRPLLVAAALALLWEIVALVRQWARLSWRTRAQSR